MKQFLKTDILYEDEDILVVRKHSGIAVQHANAMDLEHQLLNYLAAKEKGVRRIPYLAVIHRLDQPVEGILVFGKTPQAAKELSRQIQQDLMKKGYVAVVEQAKAHDEGMLENYLVKDGRRNISKVVDKKTPESKKAVLEYKVLQVEQSTGRAFVRILLHTGRHHQIRVQMSHAGMALCGDRKYNTKYKEEETLALCADRLSFTHPTTRKKMDFQIEPENVLYGTFR